MNILIITLFIISVFFPSCATKKSNSTVIRPISKVFYTNYQEIWKATMLALENYLIETENHEEGFLKTEIIKGNKIWKSPVHTKNSLHTKYYTIVIQFIKTNNSSPQVKVQILKHLKKNTGFFGSSKSIHSNGLEEKTILYRILREINIDKVISSN